MTTAVCFKCGAMKTGTWVECDACGTMPHTEDDLIISMALSDNHPQMDQRALRQLGEHIRAGRPVKVDDESRANILKMIRALPQEQKQLARAMGITAFDKTPSISGKGNKENFTDAEWKDIRRLPFFIMCYVASADGKIDRKELQMITGFFQNQEACSEPLLKECLTDISDEVIDYSKQQVSLDLVKKCVDNDPKSYLHRCVKVLRLRYPVYYLEFVTNVYMMGVRVANMTKTNFFDKDKVGSQEAVVLDAIAKAFEIDEVTADVVLEMVKKA